jgi:tetratricopeptide (TPR) repeat protein
MVTMFSSYLLNRSRRSEHEALLDAALGSAPPGTLLMARLLREKARRLRSTRAAEALHLLEQALGLARANDAQQDVALALNELGLAHFFLGDTGPARTLWREVLTLMEDQDDALRLSSCLQNLAMVTAEKGEHERLLQQAIAAGEEHGDQLGLSASLTKYAVFLKTAYGDAAEARRLQARVVEMERDLGNLENQMRALCAVSCYEVQLGDLRGAERSLAEAAETGARLDSAEPRRVTAFQGDLDFGLALVHFSRGQLDTARWYAERSGSVLKSLEVLAWMASYEGDADRLADLIQQIVRSRSTDQVVPRYALYYDALTSLLVADLAHLSRTCDGAGEAAAGADEELRARSALASALRIMSQYVFLPLMLDAFLVACKVAPAAAGTTLLELVKAHPASRFHTRQQAEELLAGTPLGWEQRLPGAPRQGGNRVPPISEVLALGADLAGRLSGASRRAKVAP